VLLVATGCAAPTPAVSPPPPEEGPGVLEIMVAQSREGGAGRERFASGEGVLEGMVVLSRDAGAPTRAPSSDGGP